MPDDQTEQNAGEQAPPPDASTQPPPDPAAELETERTRATAAEARATKAERALEVARAGITDPDGADLVDFYFDRLPQEGRPASRGEWVKGLTGATAPKGLAPYLPAAPPAAPPAPPPKPPAPPAGGKTTVATPGAPPASAGAAGAASTVTGAEMKQARIDAQRTGDYTRVRELLGRVDPQAKPRPKS